MPKQRKPKFAVKRRSVEDQLQDLSAWVKAMKDMLLLQGLPKSIDNQDEQNQHKKKNDGNK